MVGGVANRIADRLSRVVYVDTAPTPSGSSVMDLLDPQRRQFIEEIVETRGSRWLIPIPTWEEFLSRFPISLDGMGDCERAVMVRKATSPQPARKWTQPLSLGEEQEQVPLPKTLITCSLSLAEVAQLIASEHPLFVQMSRPEWELMELPTGHWPMFSRPSNLADLLANLR